MNERRPLAGSDDSTPGSEREALETFLDFFRSVLARKAEGVDADGVHHTVGASTLTLGGLVKHMALVEDDWFGVRFAGRESMTPFADAPWDEDPDWALRTGADDPLDASLAVFDEACARSRAVLSEVADLSEIGATAEGPRGAHNMRWILVHMIEEYARHCGHADLIREAVDGTTGD